MTLELAGRHCLRVLQQFPPLDGSLGIDQLAAFRQDLFLLFDRVTVRVNSVLLRRPLDYAVHRVGKERVHLVLFDFGAHELISQAQVELHDAFRIS